MIVVISSRGFTANLSLNFGLETIKVHLPLFS